MLLHSLPFPSLLPNRLLISSHSLEPPPSTKTLKRTLRQPLTVSDDDLRRRGFFLHRSSSGLNLDDLNSIFSAVGFTRRRPEKISLALANTPTVIWIEDGRTKKPVAFARATGDDVFNAVVWDVVVEPSFQGLGLGRAVMERIVDELLEKGIVNIALYAEPRVLGFYKELGFAVDPEGIRGMVYSVSIRRRRS